MRRIYSPIAFGTLVLAVAAAGSFYDSSRTVQAAHVSSWRARPPVGRDGALGLLIEPDAGIGPIREAIGAAIRSISLTMYLFSSRPLMMDVEAAQRRGVHVRVLLESHPYGISAKGNQAAYLRMRSAGIQVRWTSRRFRLTHEKSMIIDDRVAFIMTTNFTRSSFRLNREFDLIDRDPRAIRSMNRLFAQDWAGRGQGYRPSDADLVVSPTTARAALTRLIDSARRRLDVYAEELQDPRIEGAFGRAARRGVRVRILLPASRKGDDANAQGVARVTSEGVSVHRLSRRLLYIHAKAMVVDGVRAFVGSQNLSSSSLDLNREVGILLWNTRVVTALETTFADDWTRRGRV